MPRIRVALLALVAMAVWLSPAGGNAVATGGRTAARVAPMDGSGPLPTFGRPTISGIQGWGFEPSLRIDDADRIYTASPNTLSSGTDWVWRSVDHGQTFKWVPAAAPYQGKLPTCVGGGDSELAVDTGGNLYVYGLTLANISAARSADQGRTFTPPNCTSVPTVLDDRMWHETDGDPTAGGSIYVVYNLVAQDVACPTGFENQLVMARSPVAGAGSTAGILFGPPERVSGPCDEGIMGNVEVSPVSHRAFVIHDNARLDAILVGRCDPVPFTLRPSGLSCVDLPVTSFPGFKTGANFPTLAIDSAGNLFAVWEQAPIDEDGDVVGDTLLYWASSTDEGETWTDPVQIPTPGLRNNIFAWVAAGDHGRVDVAWYGTPAPQNPDDPQCGHATAVGGPDSVNGDWSLFLAQTLDGTADVPTFSPPIVASEHHLHRGRAFTLIGNQCGSTDRIALGDFFQLRIGNRGEANIAFSDANNRNSVFSPHNMFVRQNGGPGLLASRPLVRGPRAPTNSVRDPQQDATYEALGITSRSRPNLDIVGSQVLSRPDGYEVRMAVLDLSSLAPDPTTGDPSTTLVWNTQWIAPSRTDPNGGKNFFVYMESALGGPPRFFVGENAVTLNGGGVMFTYPGRKVVQGEIIAGERMDVIVIRVPFEDVRVDDPIDDRLYSVTASTMTLPGPANSAGSGPIGGLPFNLIDAAPAYDFIPAEPRP